VRQYKGTNKVEKVFSWIKHLLTSYQKVIKYLIMGVLTTLVNYCVFYVLYYLLGTDSTFANSLAVVCAVLFAYVTNKLYVFESKTTSVTELLKEAVSFVLSRGFTIILEIGGVFLLIEVVHANAMISKIAISIFVVIINYFVAHFIVFKHQ